MSAPPDPDAAVTRFADLPAQVDAWVEALGAQPLPVLSRSAREIARLRAAEEHVTVRDIARVLLHDPLLSLRVLREAQALRGNTQTADISTVEHALMMLGVRAFFERFSALPVLERHLSGRALAGLMRVMGRSHHAALNARNFADVRRDAAGNEVAVAALLHDVAEMLVWCFAPERSLRIEELQRTDPALRSGAAQCEVLGFRLVELQRAMVERWRLGALLRSMMSESRASDLRALTVLLAVDLARHAARGWNNAALPDDYTALGQLLKLPHPEVLKLVERTAQQADQALDWYRPSAEP